MFTQNAFFFLNIFRSLKGNNIDLFLHQKVNFHQQSCFDTVNTLLLVLQQDVSTLDGLGVLFFFTGNDRNELRKCFVQLKLVIWGKKITSQAEVFILLLLGTSFFVLIKVNVEKIAFGPSLSFGNVEPCCG